MSALTGWAGSLCRFLGWRRIDRVQRLLFDWKWRSAERAGRSDDRVVSANLNRLDFAESAAAAEPFCARCDGIWIDCRYGNAICMGLCCGRAAADPYLAQGMGSTGSKRPAMHYKHNFPLEFGIDVCASFSCRSVSQFRTSDRVAARGRFTRGASGINSMARRSNDHRRCYCANVPDRHDEDER
jgi:hypothetical protein